MHARSSLDHMLENSYNWSVIQTPPSSDRKTFDAACEKWDIWEAEQTSRDNKSSHSAPAKSRERALTISSVGSSVSTSRLSRTLRVFTAVKAETPYKRDLSGLTKAAQADIDDEDSSFEA
jgi:hypothetical protein